MTTTQEPLLAWHSDAKLQKATVATMAAHRKADTLVKGRYWEGGKGCAVGCLIHSGEHALYEPRFGIPQALARLEDTIFENLPNGDALKWPERFLKAAKPGADLSLVQWKFLAFVVDEALSRPEAASVREACQPALEIVRARARGELVTESAWSAARSARSAARSARSAESARSAARSARSAESAAWSAAWSAESAARSARSAARSAAWSAAWSAESAARSAAWSAERSAAESAAWSATWKRYADKLIELMKEAA